MSALTSTTTSTGTAVREPSGRLRVNLATVFTVLVALGIGYVGVSYLFAPEQTASGFGMPVWPRGEAADFLTVKGVRDVVSGLVPLALLLTGHRRALGWALLAESVTPFGDATTILLHHGSTATAFGVHAATAVFVVVTAALLLTERRAGNGRN
ncbi:MULTISPECIES: DUF4267 domain-containing protein [Kitasatospora]|uniref:DUF4267 domain-containing protein n=1 Tax=Kitasatospora setae (strain ATCC 33774 / DSM 43861 / JCM 3304 / KCC A-0304 / NBRC 14216 / KM-6054) TaxID=452652 RepID=E4N8F1_KITSK|nr:MULTISPECIES: DUF4267 domain-containing protein [Kitasatospora]BAJ27482.1 hypothetical protein KSE_16570 [Kitasatospora setae KM-6054]